MIAWLTAMSGPQRRAAIVGLALLTVAVLLAVAPLSPRAGTNHYPCGSALLALFKDQGRSSPCLDAAIARRLVAVVVAAAGTVTLVVGPKVANR